MRMSGSVRAAILRKQTTKQTNMKSETDTIISALRVLARDIHTDDGVVNACLEEAAGRLEELQRANQNTLADLAVAIERRDDSYAEIKSVRKQWAESIKGRDKTIADLKKERDEALKNQQPTTVFRQVTTRLESSRLEIAAMAMQGMLAASSFDTLRLSKSAFEYADTLIAAAKEVK